jgi:hypothetical protein
MSNIIVLGRRAHTKFLAAAQSAAQLPTYERGDADRVASLLTIHALNTWAEFNRSYLVCALRGSRTASGVAVRTKFPAGTRFEAALLAMPTVLRGTAASPLSRRVEPAWHDKAVVLRVFGLSDLSNFIQIQAAFSLPSRSIDDLPIARNFYAHRNRETVGKVRRLGLRYGLPVVSHPTDLMRSTLPKRSATILEEWFVELAHIVERMYE